ncbi:hypothetical protein GSI_15255 [Ganoderma sinense ZZ0214-1]|uniref:Uncharacterized protein n=1 Tax=Ganoderma sinense ZZ0214-1 TaxID=1077348 RepID=A0A2G8RM25_9APHY|nr:hypothetical protein GSI_15255 [Ganoderma sinense ZZ0214-1]
MGGKAFKNLLPNATFPRMHPTVYNALKAKFLPILQSLYAYAAVSPEAPGKVNYGDLDIVVTGPREGLTHEQVKDALRATCSVPAEGNRTSNFAIPADAFEDIAEARRKAAAVALNTATHGDAMDTDKDVFFQVDVNVCADHAQWERTVFYSSLGDLGFFLGLFAQTAGLSFNIYGMKLADPIPTYPAQTFYVSSSMDDILSLFELSMERWKQGFATEDDIFAWLATSPFAHILVARYRSPEYEIAAKERIPERPMRGHFVEYLRKHGVSAPATSLFAQEGRTDEKIAAALKFFAKDEEHATLVYKSRAQKHSKELLNGTNVMAWTGLAGMSVRAIMDEVKERLARLPAGAGVDAPHAVGEAVSTWQKALLGMSEEDIRALVMSVKEEMAKGGRLDFDWRAAKAARLEKKRQKETAALAVSVEENTAAAVAVV